MEIFNGIEMGMHNIFRLSNAETRSISAENFNGEKGGGGKATTGTGANASRELGRGWKVSPCIKVPAKSTVTLAEIAGPGVIQHIWNTTQWERGRTLIFRCYWDGEESPSIEAPLADLFCNGWLARCCVNSLPISVNPSGGFNSYWPMPFHKSARITLENISGEPCESYFYQITYTITDVPADAATLHAQFRRSNPLTYGTDHLLIDGVKGHGHYVGTYIAWQSNNNGWWGEGEMKFFMDGDTDFATIVGTGTEDYFGGAWCFEHNGQYVPYSTPYLGLPQIIKPGEGSLWNTQARFGMYRWHVMDPIRFKSDLKVTIQALGWRSGARYLPLQDDIASTTWWYQAEPHAPFPTLPDRNGLEVI